MCNAIMECLDMAGMPEEDILSTVEDFFMEIAREQFDADIADKNFATLGLNPAWIKQLVQNQRWREFFYSLSNAHEGCVFLDFLVQTVFEDGHVEEIVQVPSSINFFQLFYGILTEYAKLFCRMAESNTSAYEIESKFQVLKDLCVRTEYTFLYSVFFYQHLASHLGQPILQRLAEEIQFQAEEMNLSSALRTGFLLDFPEDLLTGEVKEGRGDSKDEFVTVMNCVVDMLVDPSSILGNVSQVHRIMSADQAGALLSIVRKKRVLDLFLHELFHPARRNVLAQHKERVANLVARAVAEGEEDVSQVQQELLSMGKLCIEEYMLANMDAEELAFRFQEDVHCPVVCIAVLSWVRVLFAEDEYRELSFKDKRTVEYLMNIVMMAIERFPLAGMAFQVLQAIFSRSPLNVDQSQLVEFRRVFVRVFLMIAQKGYSGAVIAAFHEYAQGDIDLSLLRYFLSEFLRMVVPPFEPSFCRQMMDLLALPSSQQAMDRPTYRPLVAAFSEQVEQQQQLQNQQDHAQVKG